MAASFELSGATVRFDGRPFLSGIDLAVGPGELVALVGPSGAGKTSLLRLLNGTLRPDGGAVRVDSADLATLSAPGLRLARSRIGFVHQDHALVPILRVAQNVIAGRLGRRGLLAGMRSLLWPARKDLEEVHALLERVGVAEKLFARTDTLSGGQQQRVAVARALFQEPHSLLADEPIASVDPARGRAIVGLIVELAREQGLTLVASLHDLDIAREFFPRTVGIREGQILFDDRTDEVADALFEELYELEGAN